MGALVITLLVGLCGGLTALRLKVPAGAMIGSMLAVALFNVLTGSANLPENVRVITQIAAGAYVGSGIRYKDVMDLKTMIKPAVFMVLGMIILDSFMGFIMYKTTGIDLVTSLFACAPAGIVDMSLISADLGADSSKVAILHMVRIMSVMILLPAIIKFMSAHFYVGKKECNSLQEVSCSSADDSGTQSKKGKSNFTTKQKCIYLMLTIIVGTVLGLIGYMLKVPAGALTFSMIAVSTLNVFTGKGYMPLNLRRLTQVFAGVLIGQRMTLADIIALKGIIIPAFILLIGIIMVNLCVGFIISKVSGLELVTSLFASTPAGVSDMALIAEEFGADAPKVAILQLTRYVCIIAIFPIIIKYLCK